MDATRTTLTDDLVAALRPQGQPFVVWDAEVGALGLEIAPDGWKTFVLEAQAGEAAPHVRLGPHGAAFRVAAARERACELLRRRALDQARRELSVAELCELYLTAGLLTAKPASVANARSLVKNHVGPLLGWKPAAAVTAMDGDRLLADVAAGKTAVRRNRRKPVSGGPAAANAALAVLSAALTFGARRGLCPRNPLLRVRKHSLRKPGRPPSDEEYCRLGQSLAAAASLGLEDPCALAGIQLIMLTGCRRGEIESLTWDALDRGAGCLRLTASKTGPKSVPVGPVVFELIDSLPRPAPGSAPGSAAAAGPYVLPATNRNGYVSLRGAWGRIRRVAGLERLRLHDLRHGFAAVALRQKETLATVGKMLGHRSLTSTQIYAHVFDDDAVRAAAQVSGRVAEAIEAGARGLGAAREGARPPGPVRPDEAQRVRSVLVQAVASCWLTADQVAARTGLAPRTLKNLRAEGHGPPYGRIGTRVVYRASDVEVWIEARRAAGRLDQAAARASRSQRPGPSPPPTVPAPPAARLPIPPNLAPGAQPTRRVRRKSAPGWARGASATCARGT